MKRVISMLLCLLVLLSGCTVSNRDSDEDILARRRDAAEAHMRHMMGVLWQTDTDVSYSFQVNSLGTDMDEESRVIRLVAGQLYSGMPYTHGSGAAEGFLSYGQPDENGIYQLSGLTTDLLSGAGGTKPNNLARLSNDCADAVSWAWARVGNSFTFTMTQNMTASRGCLPVGSYTTVDNTYKKTKTICVDNGEETMYEAYACLQKADAVVTYNGSGHAMMIAAVHVERSGNSVDPEVSHVLVHEQFTSNYKNEVTYTDDNTGQTVYCLGGVDRKYTFAQLFKKGYLPVTIRELVDPAPVAETDLVDSLKQWDTDSITAGTISSLGKIASVTVTVSDSQGNTVQQATCFTREAEHHMFRMENFVSHEEAPVRKGTLDIGALAPGSYRCVTQCVMGSGETLTARDFTFEVK